jgi:regulator of nucleoside diphosphate kinase
MRAINPDIIITTSDLERLRPVIDANDTPVAEALDAELHRARVVAPRDVPPDVVTMHSELVYEDCDTHARREVQLVYPHEADASTGRISVLAPIGSALLGLRVGQTITWRVPSGARRLRVVEIRHQPEASGDGER